MTDSSDREFGWSGRLADDRGGRLARQEGLQGKEAAGQGGWPGREMALAVLPYHSLEPASWLFCLASS